MLSTDGVGRQSSPGSVSREEPRCWNVIPGTRHHQLLHSNEAPLEFELADIETASSDMDAHLALLDDEIARLKARVETRRQHNRAILSSLRRIPPELLAEVFLCSLPPEYNDYIRGRYDVKESPWVLTHVCSRWRTVALSTSSLWSRIVIAYHPGDDSSSAYPLPLVKAHIQRSGSQQLAVTFRGCETSDWEPQVEVFHCLAQHCGRWVELDMRLTSRLLPLLTSLRDQVPCLRKVCLRGESQPDILSIDCFETACSLVDFSIVMPHYIPIHLPVHQLTRYSMSAPWDVHHSLLTLASNLVEAWIELCDVDDQRWPEPSPITLPFLRQVGVSEPEILDYITVPTLEGIAFYVDGDDLDFQRRLASLLHRSSCSLRRLCLHGRPTACGTLAILQAASCIVELVILSASYEETPPLDDEATEVNSLMSTLTVSNVAGRAPDLRCMIFGCDGRPFLDYAIFLEMIRSRCRTAPRHIERAALVICDGPLPDPETLNALYALRREGLDLAIIPCLDMVNITALAAAATSFTLFDFQGLALDLSFNRPLENNPVISNPFNGNPNQIWTVLPSTNVPGAFNLQTQVGPTFLSYSGAPNGFAVFAQTTVHANIPVNLVMQQVGTNFAFFEVVTNTSMTAWPIQGDASLISPPVTFEAYHGAAQQLWSLTTV
ncbi:hypothetical protein GGX14DRAFT_692096 [Mycena pura]|uniref:F-box domain-containing protein n=1 Tax=Mycena pura TaxID=153505 RepID=A0AAD6YVP9_9AGAR|nr:hypothetical protein GGX14DRAFT_692096 [Mycena pura]